MKTKLLFTLLLLLAFCSNLFSQSIEYLQANNVKAGFDTIPCLFFNKNKAQYEIPKGSGINAILASSFWVSGLDAGNNLKGMVDLYGDYTGNTSVGPIATNYNAAYDARYKKVFKVTRQQILTHKVSYNNPFYTTPMAITNWPANGNVANGEAAKLAPFADKNSNGIYEPQLGDYPDFCGDEAIFLMLNSDRRANACNTSKLELHVLATAFTSTPDSVINNTTFLHVEVFNHSTDTLYKTYFSNFMDADLGCSENDRIGCDTALDLFYTYNGILGGNSCDSGNACLSGSKGYGCDKVALGTTFLNQKMSSFNGIENSNTKYGLPTSCTHFRNYQTALWKDELPFRPFGCDFGCTNPNINYYYLGDPWIVNQWSEENPQVGPTISAGERKMHAAVLLDTLPPNQMKSIDMAIVTSFSNDTTPFPEIKKLKRDIASVRNLYQHSNPCIVQSLINGIEELESANHLVIYPQPNRGVFTLESEVPLLKISIFDLQGKLVLEKVFPSTKKEQISLTGMAAGLYLLKAETKDGIIQSKLLVE